MHWTLEIGKIVVPAVLGFLFGRLQTGYADKVSRAKEIQNELIKTVRACATAAIDYHSQSADQPQWPIKVVHLKNQLYRIRTDVGLIKKLCNQNDNNLLMPFIEFMDAVTEYPFEANELPATADLERYKRISISGEALAEKIAACRPKIL